MTSSIRIFVFTCAVAAFSCGDGRVRGDDWIVRSNLDTLTLQEMCDGWSNLDSTSRAGFMADENPAAAYIEARANRMLLERVVRDLGYLEDPDIRSFGRSWLRTESTIAMRAIQESRVEASITAEDIATLSDYPDERIWLSIVSADSEGVAFGPFARFELPPDLAVRIDSMVPGMVVEGQDGYLVRLDSITSIDHAVVDEAGSVPPDSIAIPIIVQGRLRFQYLASLEETRGSGTVSIDTLLMDRLTLLYADSSILPPMPETLLACEYGTWSADGIAREIAFFQTRMPFVPADRYWMGFVLENILQQSYFEDMFRGEAPARYDSLKSEALDFSMGLAFDEIRNDSVLGRLDPALTGDERAVIESESTDAWIARLAENQELLLNEKVINDLPTDPGGWSGVIR